MSRKRNLVIAAVGCALVGATALYVAHGSGGPGGAARARVKGEQVAAATTKAPPAANRAASPGMALRAREAGVFPDAAPGAAAFRGFTDDYVDAQAGAAKEHMAREGISLDETRELTYFAALAIESQDWARVESLTGSPLSRDQQREVWEAMMARSQEMRRHLQDQVASGASEDTRWQTIGTIEEGYLSDYFRITGMTPAMLDALLLASVRDQRVNETLASLAPGADPVPSGGARGTFVKRDPLHPERPPVPVDHDEPQTP